MITSTYVAGIQKCMLDKGMLSYTSEEEMEKDAEALGESIEEYLAVDRAALLTDGAISPEGPRVIAATLAAMAEEKTAEAKADHISEALQMLSEGEAIKLASSPGNNNVVAGHNPGHVAAGESVAKNTDHKKQDLSTQIPNDRNRPSVFSPKPGHSSVKAPMLGRETASANQDVKTKVKEKIRELATSIPITNHRPNYHGKPGHQADENKGKMGTETKHASVRDFLARL